jgi:PBSX family phage terminase large subunit
MNDFLEELARGLATAAKKPNVLSYISNSPIHEAFHKSDKVGRILRGGNRSGKSVAGAVEGIWRATGRHPHQKTHDLPTRGRIVTVDRDAGMKQIILPLLKQWVPPSEMVNGSWEDSWSSSDKVFRLRNGSEIEVKTHQQEVDSFAGVPRHWIWFDEECPQAIFNECRLRLIDYNGVWFMTMTPVEGQDWIFERFILTANKNVDMFEVDIRDNPHLNKQALELLEDDLTDDEKEVRQKGIFVPRGGFILREFDLNRHVIEGNKNVPRNWAVYVSIDHGLNNPTAVLWHAVSPQKDVITFMEHYRNRMLIKDHAARIKEINRELGIEPKMYMCDPSMSQRSAETGHSPIQVYRMNGIPVVAAKKDVAGGLDKMNEYFKYDKWHITKDCPNTIRENKGYAFKIFTSPKIADRNNVREEPNKKNDHCPDACRYFFSFMPWLGPEEKNTKRFASLTQTNPQDFPWEVDANLMSGISDDDFAFGEIR